MIFMILRGRVPKSFWEGLGRPLGGSQGGSWEPLGPLLGAFWANLGALWAVLRTSWAVLGASWAVLSASWAVLEPLGRFWAVKSPQDASKTPQDASGTPPTPSKLEVFLTFLHMFMLSQKCRPEMGSKMGSKNGIQQWDPK